MSHLDLPYCRKVVASEKEIADRVKVIAQRIAHDYRDKVSHANPLVVVCVLKGSYPFMADLSRALFECGVPIHPEFICVSSYAGGTKSLGEVRMLLDLRSPIRGRHVLMVEDIVDTARTLDFLLKLFGTRSPASLKIVSLLDKKAKRMVPLNVDYVGFDCDDFVVGYGLDYDEKLREIPCVVSFNEEVYKKMVREAQGAPPPSKL